MIHHAVSVLGFVIFAGLAWLLSTNRRRIAWKTIAWGVALQLIIGLIIFRLPGNLPIGTCTVRVTVRDQMSNVGTFRVRL